MNLNPLGDKVVVQKIESDATTPGGIIIPDTAKEKPSQGKVVAVGPGSINDKGERMPMSVKVDDQIVFRTYAGTEIRINDEEYMVLSESEILAIVE